MSTYKTRIQLKRDTNENWQNASNFVPLAGEVIVYMPDENSNCPYTRIKIGDGETALESLPFILPFNSVYNNVGASMKDIVVPVISDWKQGAPTEITLSKGVLTINPGVSPKLELNNVFAIGLDLANQG